MIYFNIKFYNPNSNNSLVIHIKQKAKCRFHMATICYHMSFKKGEPTSKTSSIPFMQDMENVQRNYSHFKTSLYELWNNSGNQHLSLT